MAVYIHSMAKNMGFLYAYRYFILGAGLLCHVSLFWPGILVPDSKGQYLQAVAGIYSDHHPPLFSFLWHYLDLIYAGPGLMFLVQLLFLYGGVVLFLKSLEKLFDFSKKPQLLLFIFLIPLYPSLFAYSVYVQKDNHFAAIFFFVAAFLTHNQLTQKTLKGRYVCLLFPLLIYATSVKYQAQFCAPVLLIWLTLRLLPQKHRAVQFTTLLFMSISFYTTIHLVHKALLPNAKEEHSWQLVKLYDLSALSLGADQDLIPPFNKTALYSFDELKNRFNHNLVDPLVFTNPILTKTPFREEMQNLLQIWRQEVIHHPFLYLMHRFQNLSHMALSRIEYGLIRDFILSHIHHISASQIDATVGLLFYLLMTYAPFLILGLIYLFLSIRAWPYSKAAPPLLGICSLAFSLPGVLFFLSMAGTPRYIYLSALLLAAASLFAYRAFQDLKQKEKRRP